MPKVLRQKISNFYRQSPHTAHLSAIAVSVMIIYWLVIRFDFLIGWDDQWFVTNRYTEGGFSWKNLCEIVTVFYSGQYAPVNQFYYSILYNLFGYEPAYFHIGSVLLHLCNALLLYHLLDDITKRISAPNQIKSEKVAFLATLLFAISPFNLEPVAWIAASKVLLYALFYLLSIKSYCSYLQTSRPKFYYLTIFWFIVSFGAKEQAVSLPLCLLLMDYVYNRNFRDLIVWYEKIPLLILAVLLGIITLQSQGDDILEGTHFYPGYQRVVLAFYTLSEYFTKTIVPVNLSYLYPFPFQVGESTPVWMFVYPIVMILMVVCFYRLLQKKWLAFGLLFFLIHIALVLNVLSLARYSVVADRYAYLSTIGLYFILAYFIVKLFHTKYWRLSLSGSLIYFFAFMIYSGIHLSTWKNATTLKAKMKKEIEKRADFQKWKNKQNL